MNRDIKALISQMTLEEKSSLCSGLDFWHTKEIGRLGIPSIMVADGPHGLRKQRDRTGNTGMFDSIPATCFPSAVGLASTWNRKLIERVGSALGEECQAEDVSILLGPGANIKRSPLCGRNFEYFSEDPYLSSEMAANHISGVQSQGVGTSLKHFAVNNQEHRRMSIDAIVDERTLREIYLASFEEAIKKAKPWTVMCSYNKVNGDYASEHDYLLSHILRNEWGFDGFVVSDWGAVNERVKGLSAGLELEMPSSSGERDQMIKEAVLDGTLLVETLDRAVERLLRVIFKAVDHKKENASYLIAEHHQLAREAARESMVLLKNEDDVLPLKKEGTLTIIGGFVENPRYQGGGSSHIIPTLIDSTFEEIKKMAGRNTNVLYAKGYQLEKNDINEQLVLEAIEVAGRSDVTVLFVGLPDRYESEGYDREHMRIPENQFELIEKVADVQKNLVVVLSNGAPIEMPWINKVKGLLEGYLGGQATGGAIADLLFGETNPSGKLAETFPKALQDNPSYLFFPGEEDRVEYREGIFVGYRYYDTKNVEPLFPFGFGLSYTNFEYENLWINRKDIFDDETVNVTVDVINTGSLVGKEIVQLYVRDVSSSVIRPNKELKGFEKLELQPGEKKTVTFTLDKRAFAYYNVQIKDWHVETGDFEILVAKSSREIVLKETLRVNSTVPIRKPIHRNTTVGDLLIDPILGSVAQEILARVNENNPLARAALEDNDGSDMMGAMMKYMPLRGLVSFSQGTFTEEFLDDVIQLLNGEVEKKHKPKS
ncbi:glycoside hydrolase family 3 C-terminal domain-containing protein [Bacillus sp. DJP31]|uniref:glycoside hydrolase family 3 C-terminal domain-containing protein n=1 Tax=Bacillus sp. DJP31 TaxID=3409789 RepID=UPI003BB6E67A